MILHLGACLDVDLEIRRSFQRELTKVRKFNIWKVGKFDRELTLLISGSYSDSGSWNRSIMSFMTCVHNLKPIGVVLNESTLVLQFGSS